MTTSQPRCADCGRLATAAFFLPSLAESEYVLAVCDSHDGIMGDGERFTLSAMAASADAFLAAFDRQHVTDTDKALRAWLVRAKYGTTLPAALTVAQAAAYTSMSERAVQRLCATGALGTGASRTSDGERASWRISKEALDRWKGRPPKQRSRPQVKPKDLTTAKRSKGIVW